MGQCCSSRGTDGVPDFLKTLVVDFSNLSEIGDAAKLNESYDIMQAVS